MASLRALNLLYLNNMNYICRDCVRKGRRFYKSNCHSLRFFSSHTEKTGQLVDVDLNTNTGVATVTLNNPPVNILTTEFMQNIHDALKQLQYDDACRAVILTSSIPNIFSSGLDIKEMIDPEKEKFREFWISCQEMWMRLYAFPKTTMAAINGHSPAGGALLAMSCDYRVMAENYNIGLTVTQLGIPPPSWISGLYVRILGWKQAGHALQEGKLFSADEALKVGLVDQVVPLQDVMPTVHKELDEWLQVPDNARSMAKEQLRRLHWMKLKKLQENDIQTMTYILKTQIVQNNLKAYMSKLKLK